MSNTISWVQALLRSAERLGDAAPLFSEHNLAEVAAFVVEYRRVDDPDGTPWPEIFDHLPEHVREQVRTACQQAAPDLDW